jgi:hypothetical protein
MCRLVMGVIFLVWFLTWLTGVVKKIRVEVQFGSQFQIVPRRIERQTTHETHIISVQALPPACSLVRGYQCFRVKFCLHAYDRHSHSLDHSLNSQLCVNRKIYIYYRNFCDSEYHWDTTLAPLQLWWLELEKMSIMVKWLPLLLYIWEALGPSFNTVTSYPSWGFKWFSSDISCKHCENTSNFTATTPLHISN